MAHHGVFRGGPARRRELRRVRPIRSRRSARNGGPTEQDDCDERRLRRKGLTVGGSMAEAADCRLVGQDESLSRTEARLSGQCAYGAHHVHGGPDQDELRHLGLRRLPTFRNGRRWQYQAMTKTRTSMLMVPLFDAVPADAWAPRSLKLNRRDQRPGHTPGFNEPPPWLGDFGSATQKSQN